MQWATIISNGILLVATLANFFRVYTGPDQSAYLDEVTAFTVLASALFIITIPAAISSAKRSFGSYTRISAMTAIVGHMVLFASALFGIVPSFGTGNGGWEPLMLVPMAVSAISIVTLTRNIRSAPGVD